MFFLGCFTVDGNSDKNEDLENISVDAPYYFHM